MRSTLLVLAVGCAPPPAIPLTPGTEEEDSPSIEILYPEPGQVIELEPGCVLTIPLIVYVQNFELVPSGAEPAEGQGHWHGGPDLSEGFCNASVAYCEGEGGDAEGYASYDGSGRSEGPLNLYVSLHESDHQPIGVENFVEISLEPAPGEECP